MSVTDEYKEAVTKLAENKTDRRFLNGSGAHAKLLINLMIGKSQDTEEVVIYTGELNPEYYEDALKTARGNIRILLDDDKGLSVLNNLPEASRKRIKAYKAKEKGNNHFFVSGTAMRFEMNHSDVTAVANFNEPEKVRTTLKAHFDKMWERAVSA